MLAPAMAVIVLLFGGALWFGLLRSLGYNPAIGAETVSLGAYQRLLTGQYALSFWRGLALSLWVSLTSTALSALVALGLALTLRGAFYGRRMGVFFLQFNLPIPHVIAAIGMLFLLSQSGLLSRLGAQLGWVGSPSDFPVIVRDAWGIGIILAYIWKEAPFIAVIVLAVLQSLGSNYEDAARNLGANGWQRFRYVTLPLVTPALLSASVLVFAFVFGAYEVPALLGVRFPQALPVLALEFFRDADLNARAEAMALSLMIAAVVMLLVWGYMSLRGRDTTP